jgi:SAM-dependent methyltransferase
VVARALARALPDGVRLVATDLHDAMLARAAAVGTARPVEWRRADALHLPFEDASFDAVACQFGVMFFSDVARALAEARRVLRPGGTLVFSAWDRLEENELATLVTDAVARVFPEDPPRFLARTAHGYHDPAAMAADLAAAGFRAPPAIERIAERSRAPSHELPAVAYCQGTPLRGEIEARAGASLADATRACADAIAGRFGRGPVDARMQALVVTIRA